MIGECPAPRDACRQLEPYSDADHLYGPENNFRTELELAFRGLFVVQQCRCLHEEKDPPFLPKPHPVFMAQRVAAEKEPGERRKNEIGWLLDKHYRQAKNRYPREVL
jgi:hypothetical protein